MHDIPLNDTQRIFADKNHNLVYKFLHEKKRRRFTLRHPPPIITSSPALLYSRSSTRADKRWPRVRKGLNVHRMI